MDRKYVLRVFSAALTFAAATLVGGCGNDTETTTTEELQKAALLDDNGIYSVLVASNYDIAQIASYAKGLTDDEGNAVLVDTTLAQKMLDDANAALVRLYGSADIDPQGTAATPGGLATSAGLSLTSNATTDEINEGATSDLQSVADDLSYAQVAQAESQALADRIALFTSDVTDGGFALTNDALRGELGTESDAISADLDLANSTSCSLDPTQDGCAEE
jgi:hypothetical protein